MFAFTAPSEILDLNQHLVAGEIDPAAVEANLFEGFDSWGEVTKPLRADPEYQHDFPVSVEGNSVIKATTFFGFVEVEEPCDHASAVCGSLGDLTVVKASVNGKEVPVIAAAVYPGDAVSKVAYVAIASVDPTTMGEPTVFTSDPIH